MTGDANLELIVTPLREVACDVDSYSIVRD